MNIDSLVDKQSTEAIDIATFNLDRPPSSLKSDEQIKRHSIDANLESKPVEKALYLLTIGEEVQKLSVVHSIPDLFKEDRTGCLQRLIPKMQQILGVLDNEVKEYILGDLEEIAGYILSLAFNENTGPIIDKLLQSLPNASTEFHIATSQTVKTIMEKKIIPTDMFVQTFLHTILLGMEHRDTVVADAWLNCLIEVIPHLPYSTLAKEVQPVAALRTTIQKSVPVRISSCRIIGALIKKYTGPDLKRDLLPIILSLCQDVSPDVRASVCPLLALSIRPIGPEPARLMLLPVIVDLAADESAKVKEIAYTTIVEAVPYFSAEIIKSTFLPLLKQLYDYAIKDDENVLVAVAASFGKMVVGLERVIAQSEKEQYLKCYVVIAEKGILSGRKISNNQYKDYEATFSREKLVLCRQHCAFNYPAVAKFVYSDNSRNLLDILHRVFTNFVIDPYYLVRRTIACSFHEVVNIYGKYGTLLKSEIIMLLKDDAEEVIDGFVPKLGYTLVGLVRIGAFAMEQLDTSTTDMTRSLMKCESLLSNGHNWRLYCTFLQQLEVLWFLFPTDIVYNPFVSLLFKRLFSCRILPIRLACVRTILVNLRYLQKPMHRNDIRNRILTDLASSSCFYDRMLYLKSCEIILDVFSSTYFKEHFFIKTLQLAGDPVPNIRWGLAKLLPKLYSIVKLPAEKRLLLSVDSAIQVLSGDRDQETLSMLAKMKILIAKPIPIDAAADQQKYEEEKKLLNISLRGGGTFPSSIVKVLVPSINGIPLNESNLKQQINVRSAQRQSINKPSRGGPHGSFNKSNPDQVVFTDEEFLVDTGLKISVSKLGKEDSPKGAPEEETVEQLISRTVIDENAKENTEDVNSNQASENSDTNGAMKKKMGFKHNIPVRKKAINSTNEISNRRGNGNIEKRHSLEVMDANKNLTLTEDSEGVASATVQRRKKSQLPRPLSCVVLPVRHSSLEKTNPPSRLPVMKR